MASLSSCPPFCSAAACLASPAAGVTTASFPRRAAATRRRAVAVAAAGKRYKGTAMREEKLAEMIERKVAEAMEACENEKESDGCRVAWDEVEEVSQAKAHLRRKIADGPADPLEPFCRDNPETDECLISYD